ncbi:MAG TPA: sugar ABC transporter substrate-binding protein [Chloroflexota bacterium]|nr:sugar ABC transporter substrate-binding protein [Chloroflexota bacterium]
MSFVSAVQRWSWPAVAGVAVSLATIGLSACGSNSNAAGSGGSVSSHVTKPVSITYGHWGSADEIKASNRLLGAFHAQNPKVSIHPQIADWNTYWTKLATQFAAGQAPDAVQIDPGYYQVNYAGHGLLVNLDPYIKAAHINMNRYWASELPTLRYQGHYYEMPRDMNVNLVLWNENLFHKAGISSPPSSWQQLLHDAQLLTLDSSGHNATQPGFNPNNIVQWGYGNYEYLDGIEEPLITEMGGHLWTQPETSGHAQSLINTPAARQALQFLVDLTFKYHVSPTPAEMNHYQNIFISGKVAMYPEGSFDLPAYKAISGFKWGVIPFPSWNGHEATMAQAVGNSINAQSSKKAAAWTLVNWISSPAGQKVMSADGINIPSIQSMAESPNFLKKEPSGMKAVLDSIKYGVPYLDFPHKTDAFNYIETVMANDVWTGRMSVPAGAAKAATGAKTILAGGHV